MSNKKKTVPNYLTFVFGGCAGMSATMVVQPLDLVKNRMQLSGVGSGKKEYKTSFHAFQGIVKNEGVLGLYSGLSANLLRQATYTTTRLGIYNWLFHLLTSEDGTPPTLIGKAAAGMVAGICGSFIGTPADVCLIRMTLDGRLPPEKRRNYSNVFNAMYRIVQEEGVTALWTGVVPTMCRAMVVNAAQLASYSQAKQMLLETGYFNENVVLHFCSSMASGLIASVVSLPVDIVKTRIQNMKTINGRPEYSGAVDVAAKILKNEGVLALWKGFTPYYIRSGPHTVIMFLSFEKMIVLYKKYILSD